MIPHERSLVEKLKSKPFALIGVNSDSTKEKLKQLSAKEGVTWRSFFDGCSTSGPIASQWNISGWPTTYVIDAKGIIRGKNLFEKELENCLDTLIEETSTR